MPRVFLNPNPALAEREYNMTEQRLSIAEEQAEFIDDFNEIDDWMMQYSCLLELTADMKPVSDEEKMSRIKSPAVRPICGSSFPLKTELFTSVLTVIL